MYPFGLRYSLLTMHDSKRHRMEMAKALIGDIVGEWLTEDEAYELLPNLPKRGRGNGPTKKRNG